MPPPVPDTLLASIPYEAPSGRTTELRVSERHGLGGDVVAVVIETFETKAADGAPDGGPLPRRISSGYVHVKSVAAVAHALNRFLARSARR